MLSQYSTERDARTEQWIIVYPGHVLRNADGSVRLFDSDYSARKVVKRLTELEARWPNLAHIPEKFGS